LAVAQVQGIGLGLQHGRGHGQHRLLDGEARLQGGLAADPGPATGPGAAAIGRRQRVTGQHPHQLDRHAHGLRHDLANDGFGALALLGDARGR
jgi:hypothetical protein